MFSQPIQDEWIVIFLFAATAVTLISIFVAHYWSKVRLAEMEATLKQDMIQRGMAPDEIERVLKMGQHGAAAAEVVHGSALSPAVIGAKMAGHSYDSEDIDAVMRALQEHGPLTAADLKVVAQMVDSWADSNAVASVVRAMNRVGAPIGERGV